MDSSPHTSSGPAARRAWRWVPSLYFAQGLPNVAVTKVAEAMFKDLQVPNAAITFYTRLLSLPWALKPLWSPLVDRLRTKRAWIVGMQLALGAAFGGIALAVPAAHCLPWMLTGLAVLAVCSATHDIAADSFYLHALSERHQSAFVGVRNTCFRLAGFAGSGGLVYLAGVWNDRTGSVTKAWMLVFALLAAGMLALGLYHAARLPRPATDRPVRHATAARDFLAVALAFFRKPGIAVSIAFLLVYRFAEAQLVALVTPFLLDPRAVGGLGLSKQQVGIVSGTIGVTALLLGGLLGGWLVSRFGLRRLLWPMLLAMHLPNLAFYLLAQYQPDSLWLIGSGLAAEQFGYGLGFTAYMLYMIMVSEGENKTVHYAICTGFMALGLNVPGMFAGRVQAHLGYPHFFLWVLVATLPSFGVAAFLRIDPAFGRKD